MRTRSLGLLFLLAALPAGTAQAASPEPALCEAYATAAVVTVNKAAQSGCNYGGARWTTSYDDHYNACMGWQDQAGQNSMNETIARANDLAACLAKNANQPMPYYSDTTFGTSRDPVFESYCWAYAYTANMQAASAAAKQCGFSGPRWVNDFGPHLSACKGWGGKTAGEITANETIARSEDLVACEAKLAAAPAPTGGGDDNGPAPGGDEGIKHPTVTGDVDVYDRPGGEGNVVGMLNEGSTVQSTGCRADNWCEVIGRGWVWGDFLRF